MTELKAAPPAQTSGRTPTLKADPIQPGRDKGIAPTAVNIVSNSPGPGDGIAANTKYTIHDVLEKVRAMASGQPDPFPDMSDEVVEQAKRSGVIPVGTGESGKVMRPDEGPSRVTGLGTYGSTRTLTPAEAVEHFQTEGGKGASKMVFPRPVNLTTDDRQIIHYPAGIHDVPNRLVTHPYLHANGVVLQTQPAARDREPVLAGGEKLAPRK